MSPRKASSITQQQSNDSEVERELPEGWAVATLQEVGAWRSGGTPSRTNPEYFGLGIPWVKSGDLPDGPITKTDEQITPLGLANSAAKLMPTGTICMALYGATIGKLGIMTFEAATNQATANIAPDERLVDGKYVFHYLMSERQNFIDMGQGGAQPNISQEIVRKHPIKLAPLAEQRRIVSKLEEVLGNVQQSQQRLARIPVLLKRFRQSVLAAACSGKLTADWRETRQLSQKFELVLLEDVADYLGGFAYRSPTFTSDGKHQVIRIGNVRPTRLEVFSSPVFISNALAKETERFRLRVNDIVISMTGTKYKRDYGYASIVREEDGSVFLNQRVSRVRCGSKLLPQFLLYWMHSDMFRNHFFAGETGNVNQGNVGADGIRKAQIELPSLTEQQEIVKRVEQLFAFADQIEIRFKKAQAQVDRLTQSVLAEAFRGELVPTEAELARRENRSYEPASELLARIQSERERGSEATKATPKRKRTTTRN